MTEKTHKFLADLFDKEASGFRFTCGGRVTLLSSCFGVMLAYLLGRMDVMDRDAVARSIRMRQQEDGLFVDPLLHHHDLTGSHDLNYISWQCTYFSLIALDMLESVPRHPLRFLTPFMDGVTCKKWLEQRNWSNFWYSSNEIMFLLFFFTYSLRRAGHSTGPYEERAHQILDLLDMNQDPMNGYWGNGASANSANGMYGAAHIYLFYDYYRRPVNHCEAIVGSTLALQHDNGLLSGREGGGCEDYDGVEVLVRMLGRTPSRDAAIRDAIARCRVAIIERGRKGEGGYPYRFSARGPAEVMKKWIVRLMGRNVYYYSGWKLMSADLYSPDLWATYFRILTIALADAALQPETPSPYRGYELPGWGYLGRTALHPQGECRP